MSPLVPFLILLDWSVSVRGEEYPMDTPYDRDATSGIEEFIQTCEMKSAS